tara:strand:- start:1044 stop:2765 length:1722 start_codon:yes stop_codon:yes gene_type:complete
MITFEKIRWKNFLATGDHFTEIELDSDRSTLIIGTNGAGKSTILDAITFVLFNKPFRKVTKGQLVNTINEKGTVVEIEFTTHGRKYLVRRQMKPAKFEIFENNELVDQDAANRDYQKHLEQTILKLNFKSFTQVVILGSSTFVPFMQLNASVRREVVEDLLDIQIFGVMNTLLKDRIKEAQDKGRDCDHLLAVAEERIETQQSHINKLTAINEERVKEKEDTIENNKDLIKKYNKDAKALEFKIKKQEPEIDNYKNVKKDLEKLKGLRIKIESRQASLIKELKFFTSNEVCPTCTQPINIEFKEQKCNSLDTESNKYAEGLVKLESQIDTTLKDVDKLEELNGYIFTLKNNLNNLERDVLKIEKDNLKLEKQIKSLTEEQPNMKDEYQTLTSLKEQFKKVEEDCSGINKVLDEYTAVSYMLKDSGIKSKVINKYIPIFNTLINKYLQSMDFFVNFTLDEEFNEVIRSRFRDQFSYASFSEGEKQKIDLALLFTWREVARMKNSAATNLLILDEVFDSSLDDSSTQELLKILRDLGSTTNVFVISHKGEILQDKFMRTLKFEKLNDFSKMTDAS